VGDERQRRPLKDRLTFRFGVGLCLGAAAILVVVAAWNLNLQRDHMTDFVRITGERAAETIRLSTRDAMLRNSPQELHSIVASLGAQADISHIRIFDREGRITVTTRPDELHTTIEPTAEQCVICHAADPPLAGGASHVRTFQAGNERRLAITSPILNEPDCTTACHAHPPDQKVLGVLDVELSLAAVDTHLAASERQMAAGLLVTVLAVLLLAGFLVWLMVIRPVRGLTEATVRMGRGELAQVPVSTTDEVGALGESWNRMVGELGRARAELQGWSRMLEDRVREKTHELEEAHKRMLVVEKMASLGKLAAVVAHEINNPLAGIATYARLVRKRVGGDGENGRALQLMEEEATRCGGIVRNLLLFSRNSGARFAKHDLGPLVERCLALVRHQADLQEVTLHGDVARGLPALECDSGQIQQLLVGLAMNAIEAMADGGSLAIRAARDGEELVLTISDTGCGIPPEHLEHIFEPFYTTKEEGKGVGLGLAVAYGIVHRHHGRIDIASTPGSGTTFTIRLPLCQPSTVLEQS